MASFHEVQFPPEISYGATGGPNFRTTIITLSSGSEQRNIEWSLSRGQWDVAHGLKTQAELNILLNFFFARRGKAYGFRFKDWSDYRLPFWLYTPGDSGGFPVLFTTDGVTTHFQLTKVYSDTANSYSRVITKPVAGTFAFFNNGVPLTSGPDYALDLTTGIVTLATSVFTLVGHQIAGYCEFDVPVRFDVDDMKTSINDFDNLSWQQIPIVEIREIS
jgi:uncharacterized protein (TIGR02217 family)